MKSTKINELLNCPFCGSKPEVNNYPTFIIIYCDKCKKNNRNVEVFGDGHYSAWAREQKPNENGMISMSSDLNPVSDIEAYNRIASAWNERIK